MSLDDAIEIVDHDPHWAGRFRGERDRVRIALATASLFYEHIGSTAVPGLAGRAVVDLLLGAAPTVWAAREELRARIVAIGYEDLGDGPVPGSLAFRMRRRQAFDLLLVERDGEAWREAVLLRNHLRAHAEEAAAYGAAKRGLVTAGAAALPAYAAQKAPLLAGLLARAREAAAPR